MKRTLALVVCVVFLSSLPMGCSQHTAAQDTLTTRFSASFHNLLSFENDNFLSGLISISDAAKKGTVPITLANLEV